MPFKFHHMPLMRSVVLERVYTRRESTGAEKLVCPRGQTTDNSSLYRCFHKSLLAPLHPVQRLRKVRAQILGGLNAARHSHQAVGYTYGR